MIMTTHDRDKDEDEDDEKKKEMRMMITRLMMNYNGYINKVIMKKRIRMILRMMNKSRRMRMCGDAGDLRDPAAVHGAGGGPEHQARTSSGHRQGKTTNLPCYHCRA